MQDLARNLTKLAEIKGWNASNISKQLKDLGLKTHATTIGDTMKGKKQDCYFTLIEKLALLFGVRPQDLISVEGFDDDGRPKGSSGSMIAADVEFAASQYPRFYFPAIKEKNIDIKDCDFNAFGREIAKIAMAHAKGGEFEAQNQLIKSMSGVFK